MQNQEPLACLNCQAENQPTSRTCCQCGQSLAPARTNYYLSLTETDITSGRYEHARGNLAKADVEMLALSAEQRRDHLLTARAFWLQSLIYYYKGQIDESREELLLALQNLEGQPSGAALLANVLNNLGNVELYHDNIEAATGYYQRSIEVALQAGEHPVAAKAMGNLGIIHSNEGRMSETLFWYTRALEQAEISGEPIRIAEVYRLLAGIYSLEGPYSMALDYAAKALALCPQIEDLASVCRINDDAGKVYLLYGDLDQAEICLVEAQEVAQRTGYKLVQIATLANLAELMRLRGDNDAWFNYASRAYNLPGSATYERGDATLELIIYYLAQQDWVHARKFLQALEEATASETTSAERFNLSRGRALFHAAMAQWDEAETYFEEAIDLISVIHDRYRQAVIKEEYAAMLLRRASVAPTPDVYARAYTVLSEAAATFREMEMPLRLVPVEAHLEEIAALALPSSTGSYQSQPLSAA
jgi:tetratricopeptide (TPR) repeat protein